MFKEPFSFEGRIRRTEYGFSFIIYIVIAIIINMLVASGSRNSGNSDGAFALIFYIPMLWFLWAQGAKRCHDLGNSGWWQLIPFYALWLFFVDGKQCANEYGESPKGIQSNNQRVNFNQNTPTNTGTGYEGGYSGGHNNPNSVNSNHPNQSNSGEYQSGDLYH